MLVPTLTILQSVVPAAVVVFVAIGLHCLGTGAVWEVTLVLGVCGTCYRQTDRQTDTMGWRWTERLIQNSDSGLAFNAKLQ